LLEAAGLARDVVVVPIAVDTDELPVVPRSPQADHITHVGTMYWPPNIDGMLWFIREIYPVVRAQRPSVTFDLIGSRPPHELVALQHEVAGLNVTGYVADLQPYLEQCGVFIVPLRAGGGMRVKILEALSRGLPVVTTRLGCEGIGVRDGEHVLIADSPQAFAEAVLAVLGDPALASRLGASGRRLIETRYDYRAACRPLDRLYQQPRRSALSHARAAVPDRSA
jgi:glycosyltransferase involved in cell wall biosynthesis